MGRALGPRRAVASPFPPLGESLVRGALAAGGSPVLLATAFLGLLALWGGFTLLDAALSAQGMVYVMGLPPVHVPLDVGVVQSMLRTSSTLALVSVLALGTGRGLILGALAILVHDGLRGNTDPSAVLRRLPRVAVSVFGVYGAEVGLFLFLLLFVQAILGPAAVLLMLVLGLHFLGFAPVVAAAEGVPAGAALRIGFRAGRLPGARHLTLVLAYFAVVLYAGVGATAAAGEAAPATPSILTWAIALLATFGHVVMLGALAHRWDAVRDRVLAEDGRRQEERRAARGRGRGRRSAPSRKASSRDTPSQTVAGKAQGKVVDKASSRRTSRTGSSTKAGKGSPKGRGSRRGKRR
ncbi:MAG TPA: hypothetical protein VGR49_01880 [Actinomycetota bacterium]|nr:hypothetical protein [Actinomycetota bacterium]